MIIPSIDLMDGQAVQLVGGKEKALEAGDPRPLLEKFSLVGEVAVIDLDAALGRGSNKELIKELCQMAPCRVGGGIRDVETALDWLDAGAAQVILGTAAKPEILKELPRERVSAALDAVEGEVVVKGWTTKTGRSIDELIAELDDLVGHYLITFVEKEGRLGGSNLAEIKRLIGVTSNRITFAGGVSSAEEVAQIDSLGADAQVGMALYKGIFDLADSLSASLTSDRPDGLYPTVVCDESGVALGLCYSNDESLKVALNERRGVYWSRSRGLWRKGESSGATQELVRVKLDCDRDALLFQVRQEGVGFCHLEQRTCFGPDKGIRSLERVINQRRQDAPEGSYTKRLFDDAELLGAKLLEEAKELEEAKTKEDIVWEAADVLYFTLVKMAAHGVHLEDVEAELFSRTLKVRRRKGDAK